MLWLVLINPWLKENLVFNASHIYRRFRREVYEKFRVLDDCNWVSFCACQSLGLNCKGDSKEVFKEVLWNLECEVSLVILVKFLVWNLDILALNRKWWSIRKRSPIHFLDSDLASDFIPGRIAKLFIVNWYVEFLFMIFSDSKRLNDLRIGVLRDFYFVKTTCRFFGNLPSVNQRRILTFRVVTFSICKNAWIWWV